MPTCLLASSPTEPHHPAPTADGRLGPPPTRSSTHAGLGQKPRSRPPINAFETHTPVRCGPAEPQVGDGSALMPGYGASKIAPIDGKQPGTFATCSKATAYVPSIDYRDLRLGNRYCVFTTGGRRSLVKVSRVGPRRTEGRLLKFEVVTWERAQAVGSSDDGSIVILVLIALAILASGGSYAHSRGQPTKRVYSKKPIRGSVDDQIGAVFRKKR